MFTKMLELGCHHPTIGDGGDGPTQVLPIGTCEHGGTKGLLEQWSCKRLEGHWPVRAGCLALPDDTTGSGVKPFPEAVYTLLDRAEPTCCNGAVSL